MTRSPAAISRAVDHISKRVGYGFKYFERCNLASLMGDKRSRRNQKTLRIIRLKMRIEIFSNAVQSWENSAWKLSRPITITTPCVILGHITRPSLQRPWVLTNGEIHRLLPLLKPVTRIKPRHTHLQLWSPRLKCHITTSMAAELESDRKNLGKAPQLHQKIVTSTFSSNLRLKATSDQSFLRTERCRRVCSCSHVIK